MSTFGPCGTAVGGSTCGRAGVHPTGGCILHFDYPDKSPPHFDAALREMLLQTEGTIDLRSIHPPKNWKGRGLRTLTVTRPINLVGYRGQQLVFQDIVFEHEIDLSEARSQFRFENCELHRGLSLKGSEAASLSLRSCTIAGTINLVGAGLQSLDSVKCKVEGLVDARGATLGIVTIAHSNFYRHVDFGPAEARRTKFGKDVFVTGSRFFDGISFCSAMFGESASFLDVTLTRGGQHRFWGTLRRSGDQLVRLFARSVAAKQYPPCDADFRGATLLEERRLSLMGVNQDAPGFAPRFRMMNLKAVLLHDVKWRHRAGRLVLQDEIDLRERPNQFDATAETVKRTYRLLRLTLNRDEHQNLMNECQIGETESHRLGLRSRWWLPERLVLEAYRFSSYYGGSYTRALFGLAFWLLLFGAAYTASGLTPRPSERPTERTSVRSVATPATTSPALDRTGWWDGQMHALEVATFQRDRSFAATTTLARSIQVMQTIVIPSQAALFVFALRRRFRR